MTAESPSSSSTRGESPQMSQISPSSNSPTAANPVSNAANSVTTTLDKCRAASRIVFQVAGQHWEIAGRQSPFAEQLAEQIGDAEGEQKGVGNASAGLCPLHQTVRRSPLPAALPRSRDASVPRLVTRVPAIKGCRSVRLIAPIVAGKAPVGKP